MDTKHEHEITIFINNKAFQTDKKEMTGLEIKALAGVPADYELFLEKGDQTVPVANNEVVHLHEKIRFRAIPAGSFGA
jgi:hypothetical protein